MCTIKDRDDCQPDNIECIERETVVRRKETDGINLTKTPSSRKMTSSISSNFKNQVFSNYENHRQKTYERNEYHPPVNNFAKKKRQCWEERDQAFQEAIKDFKECTNVITFFYANQSNLTNLNYTNNNESNVNMNIIQDVINKELKTS